MSTKTSKIKKNVMDIQNVSKSRDFGNKKLNFIEKIIPLKSPIGVIKKQEQLPAIDYEALNAELEIENVQNNEMDIDPLQNNFEQEIIDPTQNDLGLNLNEILPENRDI